MDERKFILDTNQHRDNAARFIGKLPVEDGAVEVVVRPYSPPRTTSQNARLWLLHTAVANETGNSAEDMHEEALCRFFGYEEKRMPTGWIKRIPLQRSSTQKKKEFALFMDSTEAWYIEEFGVWLA